MSQSTEQFSLSVTETIRASAEAIWAALVEPSGSAKDFWGVTIKSDFRAGSPITWEGVWEGKPFVDKGIIVQIDKPRLFKYLYWSGFSGLADEPINYQTVTYTIEAQTSHCTITVAQENIPTADSKAHSQTNWSKMLTQIKQDLES